MYIFNGKKMISTFLFGILTLIVAFGPIYYFNQFGKDQPRIDSFYQILHSFTTGLLVTRLLGVIESWNFNEKVTYYFMSVLGICGFWFLAYTLRDGM